MPPGAGLCLLSPVIKGKLLATALLALSRRRRTHVLLCLCTGLCFGQTGPSEIPTAQRLQQLATEHRWLDIVRLKPPLSRSADLDFYYGTALAQLERWSDAEIALKAGLHLAPGDPRFPTELAGLAFRQKNYPLAIHHLRLAIKLSPHDTYANDFLGTLFFLEGNLEASLKFWNRVDKPYVRNVKEDPLPLVAPALLDRAFVFSPSQTLRLHELIATNERIRDLEIFPHYRFDLTAREDNNAFDLFFRGQERNGFGATRWETLFLLFRGLPFSSIEPEYYNWHHQAINFVSQFRWDPQKRRAFARFCGPFDHSAKYRYEMLVDLRNENWVLTDSFTGPTQILGSTNMRRAQLGAGITGNTNALMQWSAGAEISYRDFRNPVGTALTPELVSRGYQLKQKLQLAALLCNRPENRLKIEGQASSQAGRLWSRQEESFEKVQGSLGIHWFPETVGNDYEMRQQFRAGKTFGSVPFDELFMLGMERDNDLPMHAHIGTRDGRKGSAPIGRNYVLSNWELDRKVYSNGAFTVAFGPCFDIGKIADRSPMLGSRKVLWDLGAQGKLQVFGSGIAASYGKDLRSGNDAFYVSLLFGYRAQRHTPNGD